MTHPAALLKNSWHTYGHNLRPWLLQSAPLAALSILAWIFGFLFSNGQTLGLDRLPQAMAVAIIIIFFVIFVVATRTATSAIVISASSANAGHIISFRTAYSRGLRLCWPALLVAILRFLLVVAGFILLVVPGVIWASRYSLAVQAVLLEDKRGLAAFRRSRELTSSRLIEVMIDYGVVGLIVGYGTWIALIAAMVIILILSSIVGLIPGLNQDIVILVFQAIAFICEIAILWLALPFSPLLTTSIFRDFREGR